jgi:hypothetical protein
LPGNNDIDAACLEFAPIVGVPQHKIDIVSRREVGAEVMPWWLIEKGAVRAVNVVAAKIDNEKGLVLARIEVISTEGGHFVKGAGMHIY